MNENKLITHIHINFMRILQFESDVYIVFTSFRIGTPGFETNIRNQDMMGEQQRKHTHTLSVASSFTAGIMPVSEAASASGGGGTVLNSLGNKYTSNILPSSSCSASLRILRYREASTQIRDCVSTRGADSTKRPKLECVHAQEGLALPRASRSGEIALAG